MRISSLELTQFRNYKKLRLDFSQEKNIFILYGKNGVGKTNLLEAIYILALSKSFRSHEHNALIGENENFFRIKGEIFSGESKKELEVFTQSIPKLKRAFKINQAQKQLKDFVGNMIVTLFSPEDLHIIYLSPVYRRKYLDRVLSQIDTRYLDSLFQYKKIIKHRNQLLKSIHQHKAKSDELHFWDMHLIETGMNIVEKRKDFMGFFNKHLSEMYKQISGINQKFFIEYKSNMLHLTKENIEKKLIQRQEREIAMESTSLGPHRDDLLFFLDEKIMEGFCSRGEIRSAILALKLTELKFLKNQSSTEPILLLDDVFSELDKDRRKRFLESIGSHQVIITTTEEEESLQVHGEYFHVESFFS